MQERFWRLLIQLKADSFYTAGYVARSERWDNGINIFNALVASGSVSAWAVWQKLDWLWAALVAISQVITVVKQYLPFKKRIGPLRAASFSYDDIFLKAESKWYAVSKGKLSEAEINALIISLKAEQSKAWKKTVGNITVPINRSVQTTADKLTAEYFAQTYNVTNVRIRPC